MNYSRIDQYAEAYLSDEQVEGIKKTLRFSEDHDDLSKELLPHVVANVDALVKGFYSYALGHERGRSFFKSDEQVAKLQAVNRSSFVSMFKGPFDKDYFKRRMRIGFVHYIINLPPDIYTGGIRVLHDALCEVWRTIYKDDPEMLHRAQEATSSVVYLELYLTLETYFRLSHEDLQQEQRKTADILNNLEEAFFVIEKDLKIGTVTSLSCELIFGRPIAAQPVLSALPLARSQADGLHFMLEQLFENILPVDVNLSMLPKQLTLENGKIVRFNYTPVLRGSDDPEKVIVTAQDVTTAVLREQELAKEVQLNRALISILKQKTMFEGYLKETSRDLDELAAGKVGFDVGKRILHTLKGNSASLSLNELADKIHALEDKLVEDRVADDRFFKGAALEIAAWLDGFLDEHFAVLGMRRQSTFEDGYSVSAQTLGLLEQEICKINDSHLKSNIAKIVGSIKLKPVGSLVSLFHETVERLSERLGKQIRFEVVGGEILVNPDHVVPVVKPLIHAIRNACDHGFEGPEERLSAGKVACGSLVLTFAEQANKDLSIELRDDGRGIAVERLLQKAVEKGVISQADSQALTDAEKCMLIFADDVSTASEVSDLSGRGVGLAALKSEVEVRGGKLQVHSEPGKGTVLFIQVNHLGQV